MLKFRYVGLLVLLGCGFGWYRAATRGYPRLGGLVRVSECSGDFGTVPYGTRVRHYVWITNTSAGRLYMKHSVSKASVTPSKRTLESGESTEVKILVDTSKGKPGVWRIPTFIYFQNIAQPLTLSLNGYARETFPTQLNAGDLLQGDDREITYEVSPIKVGTLRVKEARYPKEWWDIYVSNEGSALRVTLEPRPEIPYGPFRHKITLVTNDPVLPEKTTEVKGRILDRITFWPDHISLSPGGHGPGATSPMYASLITLRAPYGDQFWIKNITCSLPEVRVKAESNAPATRHDLLVEAKNRIPGPIQGQIEIITESPTRRLQIPVYDVSLQKQ